MKKILLTGVVGVMALGSIAQPIHPQTLKDSVLGWMKIYHFKGAKEGKKVDHRNYSAAQLSLCDSFANWMQASYVPKGGLGDLRRFVAEKLGLYNQHTAGRPQSYGTYTRTYTSLKYNSSKKIELYTGDYVWWEIAANTVPGWCVRDISFDGHYYFTQPNADTEADDETEKDRLDLTRYENIKGYTSFWVMNEGFGGGTQNVLLSKGNRSPFIKITRGEYLQMLQAAIPKYYEVQKKKIYEAEQGIETRVAIAMKSFDEKIERYKKGLRLNKEKYKDRLDEPAMVIDPQPDLGDLDLEEDVFTGQKIGEPEYGKPKYAIYKIDSAMAVDCKKDKPQWIVVRWEYSPVSGHIEKQQHEAIVSNFNFAYVYDFFFAPEKLKEKQYRPLNQ